MKTLLTLVCSCFVIAPGLAQSAQPGTPAPKEETPPASVGETSPTPDTAPKTPPKGPSVRITPPKAATDQTTVKKAEAPKKKEEKKKEEPKINGVVIARGEKGFLGVEIVGGSFKITFYDKKKAKVAPDVARAALRWDPKYKVGIERLVLNPDGDGKSLSNPKTIRPPYNFKLFITLLKEPSEAEEPVGETHVIDFKA